MRRLLTTTTIYSIAALIGPLVALGLTPLYIKSIGVAGYGTVDLIQTVIQLIIPLALWGLPTTLIARIATPDASAMPQPVLSSALWLTVIVSSGISVIIIGTAPFIAQSMQRAEVADLLRLYAMSLPGAAVYGTVLALLRLLGRIWRTIIVMITYVVLLACSRVVFVIWFDTGVSGMITALALTNVASAVLAIGISWRWWWSRPVWFDVWAFVRLGWPLLPASISVWVLLFIDRWFLAQYVGPLEQGQYALATLLASLMAFIAEPFKQAWQPLARQRAHPQFASLSLTWYLGVTLFVGAIMTTWAPELLHLIGGPNAVNAIAFVPWLLIAPLLSGAVAIVSMPAIRAQQTHRLAWATFAGAAVNVGLNMWLIPIYGALGAAIATALAAVVIPSVHIFRTHDLPHIHYDWRKILTISVIWIGYHVCLSSIGMSIGMRCIALVLLCVLFFWLLDGWHWRRWQTVFSTANE